MIYLDYAATTPMREEVLRAMLPYFQENFGNPESVHTAGRRAEYAVSEARDRVAATLGVNADEVYFTSGGTEADNWAVRNLGRGGVAISAIEHAAALEASRLRAGGRSVFPCMKSGVIRTEDVRRAMDGAGLICLMAANNETGAIQPIEECGALAREKNAILFSDCVQAACALDLKEILCHADAIALSGHKIGGPKGVGALIVKRGVKVTPLIVGGEQERALRGGTLNVPAIVGFSVALKLAQQEREAFCRHTKKIKEILQEQILHAAAGEAEIDGENTLPNILHITPKCDGVIEKLDLAGVCVSRGAACSVRSALPSHVMLALGRSESEAKRGVRLSFSMQTTQAEAEEGARALVKAIRCDKS